MSEWNERDSREVDFVFLGHGCALPDVGRVAMATASRHPSICPVVEAGIPEPFFWHHKTEDGTEYVGRFVTGIGTYYFVPVDRMRPATEQERARLMAGVVRDVGCDWRYKPEDFWDGSPLPVCPASREVSR